MGGFDSPVSLEAIRRGFQYPYSRRAPIHSLFDLQRENAALASQHSQRTNAATFAPSNIPFDIDFKFMNELHLTVRFVLDRYLFFQPYSLVTLTEKPNPFSPLGTDSCSLSQSHFSVWACPLLKESTANGRGSLVCPAEAESVSELASGFE